jgi:hypothetical protein
VATEAAQAAQIAKGVSGDLKRAFANILKEHGVPDWQLDSFTLKRATRLEAEGCPPDQEYDCRIANGDVLCKCWPKKY